MFRLLQLCLCDKHVDVMYTSMPVYCRDGLHPRNREDFSLDQGGVEHLQWPVTFMKSLNHLQLKKYSAAGLVGCNICFSGRS